MAQAWSVKGLIFIGLCGSRKYPYPPPTEGHGIS